MNAWRNLLSMEYADIFCIVNESTLVSPGALSFLNIGAACCNWKHTYDYISNIITYCIIYVYVSKVYSLSK